MAGHHLTLGQVDSAGPLERYLTELAALLRGPRANRLRVLAEVRDGLIDTTHAHTAQGMAPDAAAVRAIGEFGDPATIAHCFAGELGTALARRTIAGFVLSGPLVGIWWLLLLHPTPWRTGLLAALAAIPILPLVALAIAAAAATFATTGRMIRWLPETTGRRALGVAAAIATLCVAVDLTVLGLLATHLAAGWHHPVPLAAVAVAASFLRMAVASMAIHRLRQCARFYGAS